MSFDSPHRMPYNFWATLSSTVIIHYSNYFDNEIPTFDFKYGVSLFTYLVFFVIYKYLNIICRLKNQVNTYKTFTISL